MLSSLKTVSLISSEGGASFDPTISTLFVVHFAEGQGEHFISFEHPLDVAEFCFTYIVLTQSAFSDTAGFNSAEVTKIPHSAYDGPGIASSVPANDFQFILDHLN